MSLLLLNPVVNPISHMSSMWHDWPLPSWKSTFHSFCLQPTIPSRFSWHLSRDIWAGTEIQIPLVCVLIASAHAFYCWKPWNLSYLYSKTVYVDMTEWQCLFSQDDMCIFNPLYRRDLLSLYFLKILIIPEMFVAVRYSVKYFHWIFFFHREKKIYGPIHGFWRTRENHGPMKKGAIIYALKGFLVGSDITATPSPGSLGHPPLSSALKHGHHTNTWWQSF